MIVRLYLRASTNSQDAERAKELCKHFAVEHGSPVTTTYTENASGALLKRDQLMKLIDEAGAGDVLLVESIDRLTRLNPTDWKELSGLLRTKGINVVAVDFPLSHQFMYPPANHEGVTAAVLNGLSMMMLDVLAAIAHSDYLKRRERSAQGIAKAHAAGKYKGRQEDKERNLRIKKHLQTGAYSWNEVMAMEGVSRGTVAKVAKLMKVECALAVVA